MVEEQLQHGAGDLLDGNLEGIGELVQAGEVAEVALGLAGLLLHGEEFCHEVGNEAGLADGLVACNEFAHGVGQRGLEGAKLLSGGDVFLDGRVQGEVGIPAAEVFAGCEVDVLVAARELERLGFTVGEAHQGAVGSLLGDCQFRELLEHALCARVVGEHELRVLADLDLLPGGGVAPVNAVPSRVKDDLDGALFEGNQAGAERVDGGSIRVGRAAGTGRFHTPNRSVSVPSSTRIY